MSECLTKLNESSMNNHDHRMLSFIALAACLALSVAFLIWDMPLAFLLSVVGGILVGLAASAQIYKHSAALSGFCYLTSSHLIMGGLTYLNGTFNSTLGMAALVTAVVGIGLWRGWLRAYAFIGSFCVYVAVIFQEYILGVRVNHISNDILKPLSLLAFLLYASFLLLGFMLLISKLRGALEKVETEKTNAENANRTKSDFLANMSHEIRTPLNGIFGSLQVIRGSPEDQSTVARYTNVAMQSYHSIIGIVNDVLDLSKMSENKVEIYPEPSSVAELVSFVSSEMGAVALNKGIDLSSSCSPELAGQTRLIDRTRLTQLLRNILSNAVKFTKSGSVTIDAQVGKSADEVVITITDTGVGIPEEKLSAIFEPFEQVESSRAVERSGTGLGLPIAKQLAELMGGSITVKSTEGVGTTFTVVLKLPQTTLARTDKLGAIDIAKLQPARILLAEDVMTNRMIFNAVLKDCPYTIDEAENGELAVERALSQDYDLVLLDIQMPVMDGLSALQALKTVDYPKPIIACTANVMKEDIAQYMEAGFDSVICKPYLKEDLVACIQTAVTREGFSFTNR